ncbi:MULTISPECIES: NADP-dependent oxidoreductase [Sphingobacterium]|uniref:NADPH:quinone oxidoreductase n=1 Tax=Sphingobacterium athyrii TaxID=2152717 RepID=A0A363NWC7_9SPHI|nr:MULTISPECIES: NADP-dependent oxidoreductase [Sphingobacterium]PUV25057.1 NADPH:quinone oxidoreductase [Sphingobacterium athyrii]QIH34861.1 NADP-dependent oxidoreductase [Sphingobacterium sp. DR205]
MKAFVVQNYGKKEDLTLREVSRPIIGEAEVLVEIYSAGINQLDTKILSGEFKQILPYKTPFILGHDLAGTVIETGSKVTKFKIGDEVYGRPSDHHIGTFAEYLAVGEKDLALKPNNLSMDETAGVPLVALTAWQALVEIGKVKKGQKIFIQAGSGGVGIVAIQLAKYLGATVATTAGKASFPMLKELGADVLIDYKTQDFEAVLKDYDLVLNSQDSKTLDKSLNVLKKGGKVISISGPPTPEFAKEIHASWLIKMILSLISLGVRRKANKKGVSYQFLFMKSSGEQLEQITKLIEDGIIKTIVDKTYPFSHTNEALNYVATGRAKGKVVVKIK